MAGLDDGPSDVRKERLLLLWSHLICVLPDLNSGSIRHLRHLSLSLLSLSVCVPLLCQSIKKPFQLPTDKF